MTLTKVLEDIKKHAAGHTGKEVRAVEKMKIGDIFRQGDCYIKKVEETKFGKPALSNQLAPGSSKGSRHIVEGAEVFTGWEAPASFFAATAKRLGVNRERLVEALQGPAIVAKKSFTVTHPEHADVTLPAGHYVTWGQLDPKTMRRVAD
jgi:hypothetical protein